MPRPAEDSLAILPETLRILAARGAPKTFRKGERLIEEGRFGDELYIILAGRLRAYSADGSGREITYGIYGPGEYLGEMSLDGGPRSASVDALEVSRCAMVTRQSLLAHIRERPEFALDVLAKVIRRARAATVSARELALNDAYGRLKRLIESHHLPGSGYPQRLDLPSAHRDLASLIGSSRAMVSRLIKDLERGGHLDTATEMLHLLRPLPARW